MQSSVGGVRSGHRRRRAGLLGRFTRAAFAFSGALAALAVTAMCSGGAEAAGPVPDPSCRQAAGQKSLNDNTTATIQFVNQSTVTVQTFWLDFSGKRVFYQTIAPGGSYSQKTWITHPWIVADASGTCLTFFVTNSTSATVTVFNAPGGAPASTITSDSAPSSATTSTSTDTSSTTVSAPSSDSSASSSDANSTSDAGTGGVAATSTGGSGPPTALVVGGIAAVAAAVAAAAAASQGWLPGQNKPGPLLEPGGPAPQSAPAGSPPGYDLAPTPPSGSPPGYDLAPTPPSTSPSGYGLSPTPPSTSPPGYDAAPTPPSTAPAGYDVAPTPPSTAPPGYNPPPAEGG